MRTQMINVVALLIVAFATSPAIAACDGKAELEQAFQKQQQRPKGWRSEQTSRGASGFDQREIYKFLPPDRMYRLVDAAEKLETIAINKWAWSNLNETGWDELQPQFSQMVMTRLRQAFVPAKVSADFTCLGKVSFEGKEYLGYQTKPETTDEGVTISRTIYLDEATGLPAFNIIGAPDGKTPPLSKEAYTYPDDISIEKP